MRLPEVQRTPQLTIPLLERLKDDKELYVRRSVANHLGDIAKDHLEVVLDLCERWQAEVRDADAVLRENRHWLIRHALRYPAKKENSRALRIRELAARQSRDSGRNRLD
jgi:3-methyladenine DNA glycosylase AlkC